MPTGHTLPCPDRDTLYYLYWHEGLSQKKIADQFNVGSSSVCRWMKKLNIPQRQLNPNMYKDWTDAPHRDAEVLRRLYWDEGLNQREIGEQLGVSLATIGQRMKKYGIPARDQALATHLGNANHVDLSKEALAFLSGCLLGDGSLTQNKSISAYYSHSSKHREYLEWLRDTMEEFGIERVGRINSRHRVYKRSKGYTYSFATRSYPELGLLRKRWYPNNKKRPPIDLVFTNISLRQWFIGDGNYRERYRKGKFSREVRISNFTFEQESCEFLVFLLSGLGIEATLTWEGFRIRNRCIDKFFDVFST